nr:OFA family MFS transporter [Carnobacterium funditum]
MMFLGTVYSYSVFRLSLEEIYNIGSAESGIPYMTALAFYALFMFLTGKYLERYNPRTIILVGGSLVSLGWILSSFANNIVLLTITYGCIGGAGVGIAYGVPMTVVAKWFPEKKGLAVGMVLIGFGLSPLITAPLASALVEQYDVLTAFLILGVGFGIILPFLSYPFKYPSKIEHQNKKNSSIVHYSPENFATKEMMQSKSFKGLYLNFIIGTMIGLMLIGITTNVGVEFIGIEPHKVVQLVAIFAIFNGLGRPIFGWLTDRFTSKKAMLFSYSLIILSAALLIIAGQNNQMIYILSFSIFWFNMGGWLAIAPVSTLRLYGIKNYSQNYGLVFTAYGIGAITGVSSSGLLLDSLNNYYSVFYYVIALSILGIVITMKLISNEN